MAVHERRYRLAKDLINAGADVNASTCFRSPVLLDAADNAHNEAEMFVRLLINS